MKTHLLKMFDYDRYANSLILDKMLIINPPEKAIELMAHILATQQVWLKRCEGLLVIGAVAWPDWKIDTFKPMIQQNYLVCTDFINQQNPEDFQKIISYKNSKGESFQNNLSDILTHIINHGTHHRAQIGQHLKLADLPELPATDYIFYLRENGL